MTRKPPPVSAEERALFRAAVRGVQPLRQNRVPDGGSRPPPVPQQRMADEERVVADLLSDPLEPEEVETGEELRFARTGLQHTVLRKLRRGQYSVGAELDLHGMTVVEARQALSCFLQQARADGVRCVRVVHGKGRGSHQRLPVLKGKVNHWLQQWDAVLAFCSARPADGGTGALYVLLKR